jgi:hypothetical protein
MRVIVGLLGPVLGAAAIADAFQTVIVAAPSRSTRRFASRE